MRAGSAEVETGEGSLCAEKARAWALVPEVGREEVAVEDVSAGQAEACFQVAGSQDLTVQNRGGHVGSVLSDERNDAIREPFTFCIEIQSGS